MVSCVIAVHHSSLFIAIVAFVGAVVLMLQHWSFPPNSLAGNLSRMWAHFIFFTINSVRACARACARVRARACACVRARVRACVCASVCMCVCVHVCERVCARACVRALVLLCQPKLACIGGLMGMVVTSKNRPSRPQWLITIEEKCYSLKN